jgi:hypothetical protein
MTRTCDVCGGWQDNEFARKTTREGACSCLTFAEAMALDPSEVEVRFRGGWLALDKYKHLTLDALRVSDYRRAKPKRSRVQEMMDRVSKDDSVAWCSYRNGLTEGIIAVCAHLRELGHTRTGDATAFASLINGAFLEPRS